MSTDGIIFLLSFALFWVILIGGVIHSNIKGTWDDDYKKAMKDAPKGNSNDSPLPPPLFMGGSM